jgi:hydrogenase maturation protein HypF
MGRLFDAVAALIGIRQKINYEAQAAIELESIANPDEREAYHFEFDLNAKIMGLDPSGTIIVTPVIRQIIADYQNKIDKSKISARFHNAVVDLVISACNAIRSKYGINEVALSGGVWQNMFLLERAFKTLSKNGFRVLIHHQVPANDGGVALGQVVIGHHKLLNDKVCLSDLGYDN